MSDEKYVGAVAAAKQAALIKAYVDSKVKKAVVDVDDALSDTSTNPVQNKVVKAALDGKAGTAVATQTDNGLMSAKDKTKLDSVAEGANKTTVIEALDPLSNNPVSSSALFEALSNKADRTEATEHAAGLMSPADKRKLNGIDEGANKTIVDEALSDGSTNPVQNKVVTAALATVVRESIYPITVTANSAEWVVDNGIAYKEASADRTFDNIKAAYNGNKTPVCEFEGMTYSLVLDSSTEFVFASYRGAVANDSQYAGLGKYPTSLITINTTGVVISRTAGDLPAVDASDNGKMPIVTGGAWALQRVPGATVDAELSTTSENPVQNKTVTDALNGKLPKTGGTVTGALRTNDSFSAGGTIAFGEAPIGLSQTADGAAEIRSGSADVDDNPPPLSRLKVARPTEDDDAATKKYVDDRNNSPKFKGYVTLTPANENLGIGVGLSPTRDGNNFALNISDVNEDTPTLLTGVKTPTDADTNAAATVEYVNAKVASGGVTVDDAMSDTSTNPVQNKVIKKYVDDHGAANAVLYTAQSLTFEQKQQARKNIEAADSVVPTISGPVSLCPEHITDSNDAAHVTTTRTSADDFTLTLDGGPENALVRVNGIRTPTDADTNAAATVEYVKSKVASGGITPLFANSTADCTDTTKVYVLPDGYIYGYINGAWTNTGHQFTNTEALEKVIDATCDIETISGGNYNLLKVSEVSFSSRLQDNTAGIVASTATNIVTGWIPVRQGKYYAVSALVDGIKDAAAGVGRNFVQRINAKKADGSILVYNKYPTELLTELSRGKAFSVPTDVTHMMFHIQIQDRTPQSLDISTSANLKAFEPMIVEGDTAALAISNSIDFEYVDGDADVPAIVNYTLKHDTTKEDKVSLSPYYRNVDYHMMPTSYYKGVGTDYDTTFGQNTSYSTFITAWKTLITGHGGYVTETELGNASDNQKIYLYDFKPSRITNQRTNIPKVIIVAGQHGTEKSDVYGLYYFVDNLLNKWAESPVLEYLRNHVELMIIPVLNTYGFNNFAYKNANGVNLNRNYDANWQLVADTTSDQYGGAAPFDQPETQIVRDLLLDNDDASLVVDFHTNGNGAVAQYSYINYYGVSPNSDAYFNRLIDAVAHQLASISANFNLDYSLNQPDTVFGWLNNANGVGLLRDWAVENNFAGVLVEGFNGFPNGTPFIGDVYKANEEIIANWLITALNYLKG